MPGLRVLFLGGTGIISSASAYQTPPWRVPVVESTPLRNPYWQYSRDKIACEELLRAAYRDEGFPATIVRPSHTIAAAGLEWGAGLLGDMVFDNAKLRTVVPGYRAVIPFEQGAREIVAWHDEDPARQRVDAGVDAVSDKLAATFRPGL
jgi:hypothetical protein